MVLTPTVSFEFFPPHTPKAEEQLWTVMNKLSPLRPAFFSVTYGAGGSTRSRSVSSNASTTLWPFHRRRI